MQHLLRAVLSFSVLVCLTLGPAGAWAGIRNFVFLTTSDLQGQMEPFTTMKGGVKTSVGGMARVAAALEANRALDPQKTLTVATGDDLMGRYFLKFHGKAMYAAMNAAGIEAATWGNHEFDLGPKVFAQALKYHKFPLVVSNLTAPGGSPLAGSFVPWLVLKKGGLRIGLLGLMTPDLPEITKVRGSVRVDQDIYSVAQRAVSQLKKQKVDLVVALTHIGLDLDKKLAAKVSGIDVICGGHSHTLIKTGQEVVVTAPDGRRTVIVQAGARGAHVGRLEVWLDKGRVVRHRWEAIPINENIKPDPKVAQVVAGYKAQLPAAEMIAHTKVELDCRRVVVRAKEAAVGDMIADIMRGQFKTDAAVLNGGNIRGERVIPAGPITTADTQTMLPFGNEIDIIKLRGSVLLDALNWGLSGLKQLKGRFLQVSGIKFTVKAGRVRESWVLSPRGEYLPLKKDQTYTVALSTYLAGGGDGFKMLASGAVSRKRTYVSLESLVQARLKGLKTVAPKVQGRIRFLD